MLSKKERIEKARKLKALADSGVGGEKAVAQEMLYDYMNKYGITEEEIRIEQRKEYEILIDEFRSSSYRYMSNGKVNSLFWNYELSKFGIRENLRDTFYKSLSFSNYKDFLRKVIVMNDGKIMP